MLRHVSFRLGLESFAIGSLRYDAMNRLLIPSSSADRKNDLLPWPQGRKSPLQPLRNPFDNHISRYGEAAVVEARRWACMLEQRDGSIAFI